MFSAITRKTWRDLWIHKKQSIAVMAAICVSSFTLGTILMCYGFLSKALQDNYQRSGPAVIRYQLQEPVSVAKAQDLRQIGPNHRLEFGGVVSGTITNQGGESFPLILFVVRDFSDFQVDIVDLEQGHWPAKNGQIVIEKQAMSVLKGQIGESIHITSHWGLSGNAEIVALGHDVSVAQAEWENTVYAYVDMPNFVNMGGEPGFTHIKLNFDTTGMEANDIHQRGVQFRKKLAQSGVQVEAMQLASGKPPHANITSGMFLMQIAFGVMCCLLSGVLVVNLMSSVLSKQISQIGIMKSLGAQPRHIRRIYLRSTLLLCSIANLIGLSLAWFVAHIYADALANMMNIDIFTYGVPFWVVLVIVFFGFVVPVMTVLWPMYRASHLSIKQALMDYDAGQHIQITRWLDRVCQWLPLFSSELRFSARNIYRKKARFLLTTAVTAIGAGILMTAFNVTEAMNQAEQRDKKTRLWHTMITLVDSVEESVLSLPTGSQGGGEIRPFYQSKVRLKRQQDETLLVSLSQPKVSHQQISDPAGLLQPKMLKGFWLTGEENQIVFSQLALEKYPEYDVGDKVVLNSGATYELVGIAEVFGSATLYSGKATSLVNGIFLGTPEAMQKIQALEQNQKLLIKRLTLSGDMAKVIVDHFEIVFAVLLLLAAVTLLIAGKSVVLTTAINAQERTREIGVLKAIGANKLSIYIIVMGESLWSALLAWIAACVIAIPLSGVVSWWVGSLLVSAPFPLALHMPALILTLPLVVMLTLVAAYIPLRKIADMSAKEALAYV